MLNIDRTNLAPEYPEHPEEDIKDLLISELIAGDEHDMQQMACENLFAIEELLNNADDVEKPILQKVYQKPLRMAGLDVYSPDLSDHLAEIYEKYDFVAADEALIDTFNSIHYIPRIFYNAIFMPFIIFSQSKAILNAVDDLQYYKEKVLPKLDKETLIKNIDTRQVMTLPAHELKQDMKNLIEFTSYVVEQISSNSPMKLAELQGKASKLKPGGNFFSNFWQGVKLGFRTMTRKKLSDLGYQPGDVEEFASLAKELAGLIIKMRGLAKHIPVSKGMPVLQKDDVPEGTDIDEIKKIVKLLRPAMRKVSAWLTADTYYARLACKQIVYTSAWANMFRR